LPRGPGPWTKIGRGRELSASPEILELTPRGAGGLSILSVRGPGASAAVAGLSGGRIPAPGELCLCRLRSPGVDGGGELLDEALVAAIAPDHLELHLHGSPPLVRRITAILGGAASPPGGSPGGLRGRALDLLSGAPSEAGARILLDQAEGALEAELGRVASMAPDSARCALDRILDRDRRARRALEPATVVLAGPTNAGKSTLFNLLVGRERMLTSSAKGTTRDAICERIQLGAWPVDLVDTAGEGEGAETSALDRAGIAVGRDIRGRADLVLWLDPHGQGPGWADGTAPASAGAPSPDEALSPLGEGGAPPLVVLSSRADEEGRGGGRSLPEPISSLGDPGAARLTVERVFAEALDLAPPGAEPGPWQPGAGVPFDEASRQLVMDARARMGREGTKLGPLAGTERWLRHRAPETVGFRAPPPAAGSLT